MKSVAPLFQAAMEAHEAKLPEWHEPDPCEDWRCGTCAYWRKLPTEPTCSDGRCLNEEAMARISWRFKETLLDCGVTYEDFGCRFWSAKPLEDKAS
jgi:hypothetical protein